jgi:PAS domain S-box-containing protein
MVSTQNLSAKLVGVIGIVAVVTVVAIGWFAIRGAEQALRDHAITRLDADLDAALAPARKLRSQLIILLAIVAFGSATVLWLATRRTALSPNAALAGNGSERGQRLLEVAPDAIVIADSAGKIVVVNRVTEQLFGYPRAELIGEPIERLVPDAAAAAHIGRRDRYITDPATRTMGSGRELWGRRKDGSLVPVEISLSPLADADGLLIVAAVRDITERQLAEKQLKESEERLEAAARGANLGLWDVYPADGRVMTNRIFESQLGYPPAGLRDSDEKWALLRGGLVAWVELLHPDDRSAVAEKIQHYLDGALDIYRAEHRVRAPDGSYKWILSVGNSIIRDDAGRPLRVNGVHIDISEMKSLQLDLQLRYEELQRLQTLRDGLVHMIVHDLRSPLTSVMGFIELLRTDATATPEERMKFISLAYMAATQMVELISSLLDINRLEAGEMPVDRQVVDLCLVADEAVRGLSGLAINRNLVQKAPQGAVMSNCDPALIRRVIGNLLGNALKFTPQSGSITLTVGRVDGRPWVEVADTGPGIPADFIGRVFDKFSQAGAGRATKRYSTGLGLTFCKLAVEAHGGTIGVTSEVGAGSRFSFQLPE